MGKKIGWEDETITGKFEDDGRKYRGVKGETHLIRVMTECREFRVHAVDDVLEPDKDGEARVFNMNCSKTWDAEAEDWAGECMGCDEKDYDVSSKYAAGILHLATYKGRSKTPQLMEPENAVMWWPFGGDKYRKLSDVAIGLGRGKKPKRLRDVELSITCEDETFQKLNINVSQEDPFLTKAHVVAFKEEGAALLETGIRGPSMSEQKKRLKARKKRGATSTSRAGRTSRKAKEEPAADEGGVTQPATVGDEELDALLADI